ncbi:MAG TPA: flavodoxin family protein [Candidatus Omnitrophica bacterium]|nr:flavodoxin family protein [Candidatus Omnitrophota bacterium]
MRVAVVYFSFTGNTWKVVSKIIELLSERGFQTSEIRLKGGEGTFIGNCLRALFRLKPKTDRQRWDLSGYDFIFLGTPVWAFSPAPAVNAFLERCSGLEGKNGAIFVTYGSGIGKERTLKIMKRELLGKGMKEVFSFSIQDNVVKKDKNLDKKVKFFLDSAPLPL